MGDVVADPLALFDASFGVPHLEAWMWVVTGGMMVTWLLLGAIFRAVGPFKQEALFVAHKVIVICYSAVLFKFGIEAWLFQPTLATGEERMFHLVPGGMLVNQLMATAMIWDTVATCAVPSMRKPDLVAHHFVVLAVCFTAMYLEAGTYFLSFFYGITEVSSIPLCVVNLFSKERVTLQPLLENKIWATVNAICRVLFALSFIAVRCFWWFPIMVEVEAALFTSHMNKILAGVIGIAGVALTALQWYWASKVVNQVRKALSKKDNAGKGAPLLANEV